MLATLLCILFKARSVHSLHQAFREKHQMDEAR
jgi:hypothetical protein